MLKFPELFTSVAGEHANALQHTMATPDGWGHPSGDASQVHQSANEITRTCRYWGIFISAFYFYKEIIWRHELIWSGAMMSILRVVLKLRITEFTSWLQPFIKGKISKFQMHWQPQYMSPVHPRCTKSSLLPVKHAINPLTAVGWLLGPAHLADDVR